MFGIGFTEMLLIGVVLLIAVGPKRLPQLMKTVAQGVREVRRASNELRRTVGFDEMMREADVRQVLREPAKPAARRSLSDAEREQESPEMGVDLAEAAHAVSMGEPVANVRGAGEPASSLADDATVPLSQVGAGVTAPAAPTANGPGGEKS